MSLDTTENDGQVGLVYGEWQVLGSLGKGGGGAVFRCRSTATSKVAAVKVIHIGEGEQDVDRFEREANALMRIPRLVRSESSGSGWEGAHVVDFYGMGIAGTEGWIAMELVEGSRPQGAFDEAEVIRFLREVGGVLCCLHNRQIAHRDLKPGNILKRDDNGKFVIVDFGAVRGPRYADLTGFGFHGTFSYVPPDEFRITPKERDTPQRWLSRDVYALGLVAAELLSGAQFFRMTTEESEGLSAQAQLQWLVKKKEATGPLDLRAHASPGLAQLLRDATHPKLEHRITMTELVKRLDSLGSPGATAAKEASTVPFVSPRPARAEPVSVSTLSSGPTTTLLSPKRLVAAVAVGVGISTAIVVGVVGMVAILSALPSADSQTSAVLAPSTTPDSLQRAPVPNPREPTPPRDGLAPRPNGTTRVSPISPAKPPPEPLAFGSPIVVATGAEGCKLSVDGKPLSVGQVPGAGSNEGLLRLPLKLSRLTFDRHTFQVTGSTERCFGHAPVEVTYGGQPSVRLPERTMYRVDPPAQAEVRVRLRAAGHSWSLPADVPASTYEILATWEGEAETSAGDLEVEGRHVRLSCNGFKRCMEQR